MLPFEEKFKDAWIGFAAVCGGDGMGWSLRMIANGVCVATASGAQVVREKWEFDGPYWQPLNCRV